jgi:hypothetical protein
MHLVELGMNREICKKIKRMDFKSVSDLLMFRKEYEQSGLNAAEFAREKGLEYWKAKYALRKALRYKDDSKAIKFKKLIVKKNTISTRELRIKTSYGAEIIIPL